MKKTITGIAQALLLAFSIVTGAQAAELAGITVADEVTLSNGDTLQLNGIGLREKLWIDVYVGSLYLPKKAGNVAEVLAQPGSMRIQMNFVYEEVASDKLITAWTEGFENNQNEAKLVELRDRIDTFNAFFKDSAKRDDTYILDYLPGSGTSVSKNGKKLGVIEGEDFRNALIEIWLGNWPADGDLKDGMLGLN